MISCLGLGIFFVTIICNNYYAYYQLKQVHNVIEHSYIISVCMFVLIPLAQTNRTRFYNL